MPLLETLVTEMRKARDRNLPYDFQHYIMISKLYKTKNLTTGVNGATTENQVGILSQVLKQSNDLNFKQLHNFFINSKFN